MRGLTLVERKLLWFAASAGDYVLANGGSLEAVKSLKAQGRVFETDFDFRATDLGRLALHVCPVDEF